MPDKFATGHHGFQRPHQACNAGVRRRVSRGCQKTTGGPLQGEIYLDIKDLFQVRPINS
jgi:hypothetical protein